MHPVGAEKCTLSEGDGKKRKSLDFSRLIRVGGRNKTRTSDPIDVNDVLWAIGQVVKLKYGREHTSEALEIWAFYVLGCVHDARVQGVFSCVHGP